MYTEEVIDCIAETFDFLKDITKVQESAGVYMAMAGAFGAMTVLKDIIESKVPIDQIDDTLILRKLGDVVDVMIAAEEVCADHPGPNLMA